MQLNIVPDQATLNRHKNRKDPDIIQLEGKTPQEIELWVEENVRTFPDSLKVLKLLLKREFNR